MFCPPASYSRAPGLRLRPAFEWDGCVVLDPRRRRLVELNLTAWLVLELCDGRGLPALGRAFDALLGDRLGTDAAARHLEEGLRALLAHGLVVRAAPRPDAPATETPAP